MYFKCDNWEAKMAVLPDTITKDEVKYQDDSRLPFPHRLCISSMNEGSDSRDASVQRPYVQSILFIFVSTQGRLSGYLFSLLKWRHVFPQKQMVVAPKFKFGLKPLTRWLRVNTTNSDALTRYHVRIRVLPLNRFLKKKKRLTYASLSWLCHRGFCFISCSEQLKRLLKCSIS